MFVNAAHGSSTVPLNTAVTDPSAALVILYWFFQTLTAKYISKVHFHGLQVSQSCFLFTEKIAFTKSAVI